MCVFGRIIGGKERRSAGFSRIMAQRSTGQWSHASRSWQTRPFPWAPISLSPLCYFAKSCLSVSHWQLILIGLLCSVFLLERNCGCVFFSIPRLPRKCLNSKWLNIFPPDTHTHHTHLSLTFAFTSSFLISSHHNLFWQGFLRVTSSGMAP